MADSKTQRSVNIRPGVGILSVLSHLNYRPWYAMAEFVDNSLQSYLQYRDDLRRVEGESYRLRVKIDINPLDDGRITIRDNAAGIRTEDYQRAFRPAELPPDQSGLAEFGMGMKSAACWFSKEWVVRTASLNEKIEGTVVFNIEKIVRDSIEELDIQTREAKYSDHYTEIVLRKLHRTLHAKTILKVKEHLASIFRVFIRRGDLELLFDGEPLTYTEPKMLRAAYYKTPNADPITWSKDIDFPLGNGMRVHGFAAIRGKASTSTAGFALFRRDRLIQGSGEESYRPEYIFGKSNSYRYQRLFGELHLDGFEVSHTKDGFQWDENEQPFLELLKEHLDQEPMPLLKQTEEYRVRQKLDELKPAAEEATENTADVIEREVASVLGPQLNSTSQSENPPAVLPMVQEVAARREIKIELTPIGWKISVELTNDPAVGDWLSVSDEVQKESVGNKEFRSIGVRVSLAHPFMERFAGADPEKIEPLLRVAVAIALAETAARDSGVKNAGAIRDNINEYLRSALHKP